jgi:hypothetical protein
MDSEQILVYDWVRMLLSVEREGCRLTYGNRYSKGDEGGKGRYQGIFFWLFEIGLMGLTIYNGVTMIMA